MRIKDSQAGRLKTALFLLFLVAVAVTYWWLQTPEQQSTHNTAPPTTPQDMVALEEFIPDIKIDLKYATTDNFTGEVIYDDHTAYLRRGTAEKLKAAQAEFKAKGYSLKIWDAYRPPSAQFKLWEKFPDARFVINPHQGFSYHSRGVAVDVTLVDNKGKQLLMPTGFDDFTEKANRDFNDVSEEAAKNALFLEQIMKKHGFDSIFYEWWHFVDNDREKYPVYDIESDSSAIIPD